MILKQCCGVIASVAPFRADHPLIVGLCDSADRPERVVFVENFPQEQEQSVSLSERATLRNGVWIHIITIDEYLGSAGAFLRGIELAKEKGGRMVLLFDQDCQVDSKTCKELFRHCTATSPIVVGNRNARGEGLVTPGLFLAIKKTPTRRTDTLATWAGMAFDLNLVPKWREWLMTLSRTLWFYWDDYVFCSWAMADGMTIRSIPTARFYSPNPPRRNRTGWRYYYEARNAVWFARLTMPTGRCTHFITLWFLEFVVGFGLRDRKFGWAWMGFWHGVKGVHGRVYGPSASD